MRCHAQAVEGVEPRMFSCAVCGKIFSESGNLKRHMRIHARPSKGNRAAEESKSTAVEDPSKPVDEEEGKHTIWTIMRDLSAKLPDQVSYSPSLYI